MISVLRNVQQIEWFCEMLHSVHIIVLFALRNMYRDVYVFNIINPISEMHIVDPLTIDFASLKFIT